MKRIAKDAKALLEAIDLNIEKGKDGEPVVKLRFIADEMEDLSNSIKLRKVY